MKVKLISTLAFTLGVISTSHASIFGSIANFDVINDDPQGRTARGFEINLHDIRKSEVGAAFGDAQRGGNMTPSVERYGPPTVTEYSDSTAIRTGTGVKITYMAKWTGTGWSTGTPSGTLPRAPYESCWPYGSVDYANAQKAAAATGTMNSYPCDHFGVMTSIAPASTIYTWLVEQAPNASSIIAQEVPVANPTFTVVPQPAIWVQPPAPAPAAPLPPPVLQPQAPIVHAIQAAPAANAYEFGEAMWVKVTATGTNKPVVMENLVAENAEVQKAHTQVQMEWQRLQYDSGKTGGGANGTIDLSGVALDPGATGVIYTMEYYKYTGAYDPGTHEAITGIDTSGSVTPPATVGGWISTQQAGVNFDGSTPPPPALGIAPTINATISDAIIGKSYSATINATPGNPGDVLSYVISGLPNGLTAAENVISGIPTTIGSTQITITVNDIINGTSMSATTTLNVLDAPIVFSVALPDATLNAPYSQKLTATGGDGVFTFSTVSTLPTGLLLDSNSGIISGAPTVLGSTLLTFTATDGQGFHTNASQSLNVVNAVAPPPPPPAPVAVSCSGNNEIVISSTAGVTTTANPVSITNPANITYVVPASSINIGSIVSYSGTLNQAKTSCIATSMQVQDGLSVPAITLVKGVEGQLYPATSITPVGGILPYTISVSGLPAGLIWDGTNIIGTPIAPDIVNGIQGTSGTYNVTIAVVDNIGTSLSQIVPLVIDTAPCSGTKELIKGFTQIRGAGAMTTATGAHMVRYPSAANTTVIAPATFSIGALASYSGKLDPSGVFCVATSMTIEAAPTLAIGSTTIPTTGIYAKPFVGSVAASGGIGAMTYAMAGAPAGLLIDANTGAISGSPNAIGSFILAISVTDSVGRQVTTNATTVISYPALLLGTVTIPSTGTTGASFNGSVIVTGGVGAIKWTATGLPAGVAINATTGAITGIPTVTGTFAITVVATDLVGQTVSTSATTTISVPVVVPPTITSCTIPKGSKTIHKTAKVTAVGSTWITVGTVTVDYASCTALQINGGAKVIKIGDTAEYEGYVEANGNAFAKYLTIN